MIYSPDVPFFRDDEYHLLDHPYLASVITTPAPNFGEAERASHDEGHLASTVRSTRCRTLLTLASTHQHRVLILGAWGCGVFRNDPTEVAETFSHWLDSPLFEKAFDHVVFAIYDRSKTQDTMRAFQRRFGS
ncbi:MAG: TIGR02452 family protein [Polyangiaceae bacterium]